MPNFVVNVCFPLSDLRVFAGVPRLGRPDWKFPRPGLDFVPGCGAMRKRAGREVPGWPGSRYFCKARRMLSLCDPRAAQFAHTYKRLFFDGTSVGCVSVGLVRHDGVPLAELPRLLDLSVRVGSRRPRALATIGGELADRFHDATTSHRARKTADARLVEGAVPVMIGECWHERGPEALTAETGGLPPVLDWPVLSVFHSEVDIDGLRVPLWVLIRKDAYHVENQVEIRRSLCKHVRNHLIRRHCERAALAHTLRAARRGLLKPADAQLHKYLRAALARLSAGLVAGAAGLLHAPEQVPITDHKEMNAVAAAAVRVAEATAMADDDDFVRDVLECMDELGIPRNSPREPEDPPPQSDARRSLHELLVSHFNDSEIRTIVDLDFPTVVRRLPGPTASLAALAASLVDAVGSDALRFDDLFASLLRERPLLAAEISVVQALWR